MGEPNGYEPWSPVKVEAELVRLYNAVAQAELAMRKLAEHELDCKLAFERAHIIASTDPMCPKPARGGDTVAERDDWIRGCESDEYEAWEMAKLNVSTQRRYMARLEQQTSIVQSIAKSVLQAYQVAGARGL